MRKLIAIGLLIVSHNVRAENPITWGLVEAIRQIEACPKRVHSRDGKCCLGDGGRARGQWQFWPIAWKDVNNERARQKLMTYSYDFAWKESHARVYAWDYLQLLRRRYANREKREPTINELWAMWNVGYGTFFEKEDDGGYGGDFEKCPHKTKMDGLRINLLLKDME